MRKEQLLHLSRRERQIMQVIFEKGGASVHDVLESMPSPPSYSTVRALLAKLETKDIVYHREQGAKYIYYPVVKKEEASKTALSRLVNTFFSASPMAAVNALLDMHQDELSEEDVAKLEDMVKRVKQQTGE